MKRIILWILMVILLAGCSANQAEELSPVEILLKASEQMKSLQGFQVAIETTGAPAYLDQDGTLTLSKLDGHYVAPDKVQANVRVIVPGIVVQVNVISIGEELWQTNVITSQWGKKHLMDGDSIPQPSLKEILDFLQFLPLIFLICK